MWVCWEHPKGNKFLHVSTPGGAIFREFSGTKRLLYFLEQREGSCDVGSLGTPKRYQILTCFDTGVAIFREFSGTKRFLYFLEQREGSRDVGLLGTPKR